MTDNRPDQPDRSESYTDDGPTDGQLLRDVLERVRVGQQLARTTSLDGTEHWHWRTIAHSTEGYSTVQVNHWPVDPALLPYLEEQLFPQRRLFRFVPDHDGTLDLESAVHQALGAASVCWTEPPRGIFDSDRAREIGQALLEYLRDYDGPPLRGDSG